MFYLQKTKKELKNYANRKHRLYLQRNEFDKAFFQQDMADGKSKNLAKRAESDKVL